MTLNPLLARAPLGALAVLLVACLVRMLAVHATERAPSPAEAEGFIGENMRAMDKMMSGMNVAPSGNVDRDFVAMMVPHHQGAIDMALAELRHGKNETLRRMAQEIIVEQQQEIVAMRLAASQLPAGGAAAASTDPQICTTRPAAERR